LTQSGLRATYCTCGWIVGMSRLFRRRVKVNQLRVILTGYLSYDVSWSAPAKKRRLVTGNVILKCGVCMTDGPVARLHPCGHLLGCCCLEVAVGKKCPFCREETRISQNVFHA